MTYPFIKDNAAEYGVATLCEALEVSRGGYYEWRRRRAREDEGEAVP